MKKMAEICGELSDDGSETISAVEGGQLADQTKVSVLMGSSPKGELHLGISLSRTDLHLFLSESHAFDYFQSSSLVWFAILLIFGLEDCLVLGAMFTPSQLSFRASTGTHYTWYGDASDELEADCRRLAGGCYSGCPESGQGRQSCCRPMLLIYMILSRAVMRTADLWYC